MKKRHRVKGSDAMALSRLLSGVCQIDRRTQALCEFRCIVVGPEVHEIKSWLFIDHVAVQRGDRDAILSEHFDHRIHFRTNQDKVTGDCRFGSAGVTTDTTIAPKDTIQFHFPAPLALPSQIG